MQPKIIKTLKTAQQEDNDLSLLMKEHEKENKMDLYVQSDGILCYQDPICIPYNETIKFEILKQAHHSRYIVHPVMRR